MSDQVLDELRRIGEELRAVFAEERRAISALDHAALECTASRKQELAGKLEGVRASITVEDRLVRDLFAAIRIEAHATALLAATATQAVRELLGYKPASAYDRRAKQPTSRMGRVLATY